MAVVQTITIYRGEAVALNFTMQPLVAPPGILGWTITFTVAKKKNSSIKLIGPQPVTPLNPTACTFRVSLAEEDTDIKPGTYFYDVWRTDEGFEQVLALGSFVINGDARVPPIE